MKQFNSMLTAFAILIQIAKGHVVVYRSFTNQLIEEFYDLPAQFGPPIPSTGLTLHAVQSIPSDACEKIAPPPKTENLYPVTRWVVLIARANCTFEQKVRSAQDAGYSSAIVYNIGSDELEQMSAKNAADIKISSVFVGETTGRYIIEEYLNENGYILVLNDELPFNINTHLIIPFSILVGLCFIIMVVYMIYKFVREQRRLRENRLPKRLLKKIPTIKFVKGQPYDSCVICLEDYAEGDKLRVLQCAHTYHCQCIDQWLTKNRRVCPICKRKVFARGESRRPRRRNVSSETDTETDDTTPLINPVENTNHGTFTMGQNLNNRSNNSRQELLDDENVTSAVNSGSGQGQVPQRVNPFDREPNLSSSLAQDLGRSLSFWNRPFFRFFRRGRTVETDIPAEGFFPESEQIQHQPDPSTVAVNFPPQPSSNNILNANLCGSFKDSDDEPIESASIYEAISQSPPTASDIEHPTDSVFIQTPTRGGIGVAALPNTTLPNYEEVDRTRLNRNRRDFIV